MKLAIGLALLFLAALLAAVGWVLAKPMWRWDDGMSDTFRHDDEVEALTFDADIWAPPGVADVVRVYSTGSPESVTSRAENGTGLFV